MTMRRVLTNATVIDCVTPRPIPGASVVIDRGRIEHEHFPEARHGFAQLESPATDKCVAQVLDFVGRQTGPSARS